MEKDVITRFKARMMEKSKEELVDMLLKDSQKSITKNITDIAHSEDVATDLKNTLKNGLLGKAKDTKFIEKLLIRENNLSYNTNYIPTDFLKQLLEDVAIDNEVIESFKNEINQYLKNNIDKILRNVLLSMFANSIASSNAIQEAISNVVNYKLHESQ